MLKQGTRRKWKTKKQSISCSTLEKKSDFQTLSHTSRETVAGFCRFYAFPSSSGRCTKSIRGHSIFYRFLSSSTRRFELQTWKSGSAGWEWRILACQRGRGWVHLRHRACVYMKNRINELILMMNQSLLNSLNTSYIREFIKIVFKCVDDIVPHSCKRRQFISK